jgi:hypothetical protein
MDLPAHSGPRPLIQFRNHFFTDGRTPWTSDQLVTRLLPKQRTTQTQNKRIHTPHIYALSGIRTHDPCASERAKTVPALDRAVTVTSLNITMLSKITCLIQVYKTQSSLSKLFNTVPFW